MMTSTINRERQQLRKVAILVATLEEPLAERLLAELPAREEAAVRTIVADLEEIDPNEYRAVVADFQRGMDPPESLLAQPLRTQLEGVELDASLLARLADEDVSVARPTPTATDWQTLSSADVTTLVEMLSAEQPQTIAVVLSRLKTSRSAELISKLSPTLQAEVLSRLADLDPADEQTLEVVASQLAQWLTVQRRRHERLAAGRDLVERILHDTPDSQRAVLLTRLSQHNPALAEKLAGKPRANPTVGGRLPTEQAIAQSRPQRTMPREEAHSGTATESTDPLSELELLDDQGLLRALRLADRQTVMLALAGASETLMKRIVKDLPRRKATLFRQQVRTIGPTRLSDMIAAQRELLRCGRE